MSWPVQAQLRLRKVAAAVRAWTGQLIDLAQRRSWKLLPSLVSKPESQRWRYSAIRENDRSVTMGLTTRTLVRHGAATRSAHNRADRPAFDTVQRQHEERGAERRRLAAAVVRGRAR